MLTESRLHLHLSLCQAGSAKVTLDPRRSLHLEEVVEGSRSPSLYQLSICYSKEVSVVCFPGLSLIEMGGALLGPSESVFSGRLSCMSLG